MCAAAETWRRFICGRCGREAGVCPACDRGQRYCGPDCARLQRQAAIRRASAAAQRKHRGALKHAARQCWYRAQRTAKFSEQKVTQQSVTERASQAMQPASASTQDHLVGAEETDPDVSPSTPERDVPAREAPSTERGSAGPCGRKIRCSFCHRPMPALARLDGERSRAVRALVRTAHRRRAPRLSRGPP